MKLKKLISFILALALVLSCAPHMLPLAKAVTTDTEPEGTPTVLYCVTDLGAEGSVIVDSLDEAFSKIEAKNKQWKAGDSVEIRIKGEDHTGGHQDGLLFGQTTIWREDGTKLPITIRGVDTTLPNDAYIYLDSAGGWYACANDYTFINLTLPIGDQETLFYAGSGNITLIDVSFNKLSGGTATVEEQTAKYEVYKYVAQKVANDAENLIIPDVSILPIGDAWQLARERDRDIGEGLMGMYGTYYGDGKHDGDTGGGQYLNACIYYEVMTGLSCLGNTWRPDYELSEEMITFLQNVAHDTVVATYGEDHYKDSWTDIAGNDNEFNILILGSSNCAYLTDELHALCEAAGIKSRVYHAYYSGVPITTQWNWIENDNGNYLLHKFENGVKVDIDNQKITDFLMDHQWDTITIYQSTNVISKYANDEEGLALAYETCRYADDFYNYMYNYENGAHQDAKYYWYQVAAASVGAASMKSDTAGKIYADNCTQAAYEGWDELEPGEKVQSSITFGYDTVYRNTSNGAVAAVGYMDTAPETPYTDETARDAQYMEAAGYDNVADIRPADVEASIIIDGEYAYVYKTLAKQGYAPSSGSVILKQGTTPYIYGAQAPTGSTAPYYGDINLEYYGGTMDTWRGIYGNVTGDVTVILDGVTVTNVMVTVQAGYTVDGDMLFDIRDGSIESRIYTAGNGSTADPAVYSTVTGTVTFRWGGGYIKEIYHGRRSIIGNFVNEFYVNPDAEIPASTDKTFALAGVSSCTIEGEVRNNFIGAVPASVTGKISNFAGSSGTISKLVNTVKADEAGNAPSFTAYNGGAATEIVNNIEAGTFGSFATGTADTVTTTVTGGTFPMDPSAYVPEGYTAVKNADGTYTVENHNYVLVSGAPATCVSGGELRYECSDCDAVKVVTLEQDPNAHDWDTTDPENMVCKNGCGKTANVNSPFEYQSSIYCEGCKENIDKSQWIPITMETLGCSAALETATTFAMQNSHYYLAEDINLNNTAGTTLLTSNGAVCLHLNGRTLRAVADQTDLDATGGNTGENVNVGATGTGNAIFAESGTLNIMGEGYVAGRESSSIYATVSIYGNASVNIYGGTYNNHRKDRAVVLIRSTGGTLTVYGGTFQDPLGIYSGGTAPGTIIVNGGSFVGKYFADSHGSDAVAEGSSITVNGGSITPITAIIDTTGGIVAPSISGGTFNMDPTKYLASGYTTEKSGDTWTVVKAPETPVLGNFDPEACDGWAYCEACYKQAIANGKSDAEAKEASLKAWTVYTGAYYDNAAGVVKAAGSAHEHLYLTGNYDFSSVEFFLATKGDVCINLNGWDVFSTATKDDAEAGTQLADSAFYTEGNLNIMDAKGTSEIKAAICTAIARGNAVHAVNGGVCNLYGGTYTQGSAVARLITAGADGTVNIYEGVTVSAADIEAGTRDNCIYLSGTEGKLAVVNVYGGSITGGIITSNSNRYGASINISAYGECNIYGGTVSGGKNRSNSDSTGCFGGNIYVGATSALNVYGGKIYDGEASAAGGNIYAAGEVNIVDDPNIPGEPEIYGGIAGTHGGNISAEGATVTMSGGKIYGGSAADSCANVFVSDTGTFTQSGDAEIYSYSIETATGRTWYATMADALANYQIADAAYIGLWDSVEFNLTEDAYVALMIGATPAVSGAYKLYAMDTTQDDYTGTLRSWTVADETEIVRDVKNPVTGYRYLNVTNTKGEGTQTINSYRLDMYLSAVSLRASKDNGNGLYYKATVSMSEALAEKLDTYGVVLSLVDMPDANFMAEGKENGATQITDALGVSADNGYTVTVNSGAVFGIMKDDGSVSDADNAAWGQLDIYANAYLKLDADGDGTCEYYMSETDDVAWSLYDVMKEINDNWSDFAAAHDKVTAFYSYWAQYGMDEWETYLPNIAG